MHSEIKLHLLLYSLMRVINTFVYTLLHAVGLHAVSR